MYLGYFYPHTDTIYNNLELLNEVVLICMGYTMMTFSDFVIKVEAKYLMGWVAIGLTGLVILINFGAMMYINLGKLVRIIRLHLLRRKLMKKALADGLIKSAALQ